MNYSEVEHPITLNAKDWNRMINELRFYKSRCELLQSVQHVMRDPERTLVCDVLANGQLYHNIENSRYKIDTYENKGNTRETI